MFLNLKAGDKVEYVENMKYILGNGQEVNKKGEILVISSNVSVRSRFFKLVEEPKKPEFDMDALHKEALEMHKDFLKAEKEKEQEKKIAELKAKQERGKKEDK